MQIVIDIPDWIWPLIGCFALAIFPMGFKGFGPPVSKAHLRVSFWCHAGTAVVLAGGWGGIWWLTGFPTGAVVAAVLAVFVAGMSFADTYRTANRM